MAGEITLLAATSAETATGSGTFGSVVNKWVAEVNTTGAIDDVSLNFEASLDGVIFAPVNQVDDNDDAFLVFDTPALSVRVTLDGNQAGDTISVSAIPYTD